MKKILCFVFGHSLEKVDTLHRPLLKPLSNYSQHYKTIACKRCGESSEWIYLSKEGRDIYAIPLNDF